MMVFRPANKEDLADLHALASQSGSGLTTLPKTKATLKKRLTWSTQSFSPDNTTPRHEYYWFVLEDLNQKKLIGTAAIEVGIGFETPFYSYKRSHHTRFCHALSIRNDYDVLDLVNDHQGDTELCTLFLDPTYRGHHFGQLLSRSRFLFIADHPNRFTPTLIAEMRGLSDDNGQAPFWEAVGAHFFHMPFDRADRLTHTTNKQFIADLMPKNPLYVPLLPKSAQEALGKAHPFSGPAMTLLMREGFRATQYMDIFDAGPTLEASRDTIHTVTSSLLLPIRSIHAEGEGELCLVANTKLAYRATLSKIERTSTHCMLPKATADVLQVQIGDIIRYAPLHKDSHAS